MLLKGIQEEWGEGGGRRGEEKRSSIIDGNLGQHVSHPT